LREEKREKRERDRQRERQRQREREREKERQRETEKREWDGNLGLGDVVDERVDIVRIQCILINELIGQLLSPHSLREILVQRSDSQ
jgi:hypothetical protein